MIFVGVDPSIVCTGIVAIDAGQVIFERVLKGEKDVNVTKRKTRIEPERLSSIVLKIIFAIDEIWMGRVSNYNPATIAIEEPFVGANATAALKTYSVFSALVYHVHQKFICQLLTPSPANIKKFVGAKEKNLVARQVYKRWKYEATDNNLIDAYAIARWAEAEWNAKQT